LPQLKSTSAYVAVYIDCEDLTATIRTKRA